jgi:Zn-finger nucleic acid-binding protein
MKCLICNIPLTMAEHQGVDIDFCPKCHGVWLDWGALDKIIERALLKIASRPYLERLDDHHSQHYDKHHDNDNGGHNKKKREFLH